jgi:chitodextrinase
MRSRSFGHISTCLLLAAGMTVGSWLSQPSIALAARRVFVQKRYFQVIAGTTVSITLRKPTTPGNLIVAYVVWDNAGTATVTDTTGNLYVSAVGPTQLAGDPASAQVFYARSIAGGPTTVTATFANPITGRGALFVQEYAGLDPVSPVESAVAAAGSSLTTNSGALVATTNALLFLAVESNGYVTKRPRGFHRRARQYGAMTADEIVKTAGLYDAPGTQNGTAWVAQLVAFRPAGTDTSPPSVPSDLQVSNVTATAATISWTASSDDTGVSGYVVFRDGAQIATTALPHYTDMSLSPATTYAYTVEAYDAAGNFSAQSSPPLGVTTASGPPGAAFPLTVGPTGRYLVDQNGVPFLIHGDSPQALTVNLSEAEADAFFADRETAGFNLVWVNLLCATYTGGRPDGSTYDGIVPFTTPDDLSTPNEAFFTRVDHMLALAAQHGLVVLLDPAETGSYLAVLNANGVTKARDYGRYLGTRYRNVDNIIWMSGNDFQSWQNAGDDAVVQAVARGIHDTDDRHIHTVELDYLVSGSLDDPTWAPLIQLNASYTYFPTYAQVLADYNRPTVLPTFMVEANYEFEHNAADLGTPEILRRQAYWTLTSGAAGQLYGNRYTWPFIAGWESNLDTPGSAQFGLVKQLFAPRRWFDLVPDQSHAVVTAGYGTFSDSGALGDNDYLTAARTPDGALVIAYMPTRRTITVDMARLGAAAYASWYDPTDGSFTAIAGSPFGNTGSRNFAPPGDHADGSGDWVLVLEAAVAPDGEPPSVPTGLSAPSVSSTDVTLAWTASHDNVGVAGYRVYRDGVLIRTTAATAATDTGLSPLTSYAYAVAAYDYASNPSDQSAPLLVTTHAPAPSFVQQSYATPQSPQSVVSASYPGAQTAGDTNIVAIGWNDTTSSVTTVTDRAGNVYQQAIATFRGSGLSQAIWYTSNVVAAPAGSNQVTVTFNQPAVFVDLRVTEYAGLKPANPFDVGASASGNGSTASTPAIVTSAASELLFAAGMTGAVFSAAGVGFTSRAITAPDGDIVEDAIASAAGSHTATAPLSGGTWLLQVAAFKAP